MNARELMRKMADQERQFLESTFVAPVLQGAGVQVRVAGCVWRFRVLPETYAGWAVLKPVDHGTARVVEAARLGKVREYLELFPAVSLVLAEKRKDGWWALPAQHSDTQRLTNDLVPVLLASEVQVFDTVRARWDGARLFCEGRNPRRNPSIAAYLRKSLAENRKVEALEKPTLTPQEKLAYEWQLLLRERDRKDTTEDRLRRAIAHADGKFQGFVERKDAYAVTFSVDGRAHTATINKGDLSVMLAGICLSGEDQKFDLASLVGVIREGYRENGYVTRVGDAHGLPEDVYRQIHPWDESAAPPRRRPRR